MDDNYPKAEELVLAHEGGLVDNPKDPGGRTNQGVTQAVYDAYRGSKHLPKRAVDLMEAGERDEVYRDQYWSPSGAALLPTGVDYAVFDFAVNSGVARAVKELQRLAGVEVDGVMGKVTLAKIKDMCAADIEGVIVSYCNRRMVFLKSLKTWGTFGKGWQRRVLGSDLSADVNDHGVVDYAILMARQSLPVPTPKLALPAAIGERPGEVPAKAMEKDQNQLKTAQGAGLSLAAPGVAGATIIGFAQALQPHVDNTVWGHVAMFGAITLMGVGGLLVAFDYLRKLKETGATFLGMKI